jgi:NAD(P)-dependent dehydrogenase (short-subunit alcohol dehydrogenase family)
MTASRAALVTGAGHGIGRACALRLAADGHDVVAVDVEEAGLDDLPAEITHRIVREVGTAPDDLARAVLGTVSCCPTIVNNVGVMDGRTFLDLPPDAVEVTWRTNVAGPWELTRLLVKDLIQREQPGSVVFVNSLHSHRVRMCPDYSTTKAALVMLAQELTAVLGPYGIRVNSVSPGVVDTWSDRVPEPAEHRVRSEALVPLRQLGTPEDVANAVAFLCDPEAARYVTGADLRIDGGLDTYNWLHGLYGSADEERAQVGDASTGR